MKLKGKNPIKPLFQVQQAQAATKQDLWFYT